MNGLLYAAIAAALLASPAVFAQNKCVDANGRITYQQDLCPGGVAPSRPPATEPPPMDTTRVVPQSQPAPQSQFNSARCEQMARDLRSMRGMLGSLPAPQRANAERQLIADERTYHQECKSR